MIAYAFLTKSPNDELINFANQLYDKYKYHIYIIIDDDNYLIKNYNPNINFIKIDKNLCLNKNLIYSIECSVYEINTRSQNKMVTAWDKAIYYFTFENTSYEHIWFIEDDVFISSINSLEKINENFPDSDLLTATNNLFKDYEANDWLWPFCLQIFQKPCYCSMMCACRVSLKLLRLIVDCSDKYKFTPFHEFSFNTIAEQSNLKVNCPPELSTVVYRNDWTLDEMKEKPFNLYHPVKDFSIHNHYRDLIATQTGNT